eukprot:TRINITY_DN12527_c0_g1_i1.p2 TRINITY_DN12527_c0_g1~~TRINITY_DN12527_c0_g1_i1.p2  ORF type:complete len:116 (-),score=38.11 TRINITY_DN12527_c0_g1_i1:588-935(-)
MKRRLSRKTCQNAARKILQRKTHPWIAEKEATPLKENVCAGYEDDFVKEEAFACGRRKALPLKKDMRARPEEDLVEESVSMGISKEAPRLKKDMSEGYDKDFVEEDISVDSREET